MARDLSIERFIKAARKKLIYEIVGDKLALANYKGTMAIIIEHNDSLFEEIKSKCVFCIEQKKLYKTVLYYIKQAEKDTSEIMRDTEIILPITFNKEQKNMCRVFLSKNRILYVPNNPIEAFRTWYTACYPKIQNNCPLVFFGEFYNGVVFPQKIHSKHNDEMIVNLKKISQSLYV